MKKIITILIIIITVITLIFVKFNYKKIKNGNNINKSAEEITKYILDIDSYEAKEEITVKSNKNINKYMIIEKCNKDENLYKKEVIEPENIEGLSFTYDGVNLKIENSKLNLQKIYKNYPYIGEENSSIIDFITTYKKSDETTSFDIDYSLTPKISVKANTNGEAGISWKYKY